MKVPTSTSNPPRSRASTSTTIEVNVSITRRAFVIVRNEIANRIRSFLLSDHVGVDGIAS